MKAAVSIPDDVFEQGERLARRLHTSRSQLYARALADFVVQHEDDKITSSMNEVLREVGSEADEFTRRAARHTLRRVGKLTPRHVTAVTNGIDVILGR